MVRYVPVRREIFQRMFGKKAFFYIGSSTAIALITQALGASMGVVLLASFVGPFAILLTLTVIHYRRS